MGVDALVPLLVVCLAGVAAAVRHGVDNVHRPDADCLGVPYRRSRDARDRARRGAGAARPDLESRCFTCHDEGPSHHTGIKPTKPVPDILPLSAEGLITARPVTSCTASRTPSAMRCASTTTAAPCA